MAELLPAEQVRRAAYGLFTVAAALWFIFWTGKVISTQIFFFAQHQIAAIYGKGEGFSPWAVFLLLLLVTGPSEEIYWRGFLQKNLVQRHGNLKGWMLATAFCAGVHIRA